MVNKDIPLHTLCIIPCQLLKNLLRWGYIKEVLNRNNYCKRQLLLTVINPFARVATTVSIIFD